MASASIQMPAETALALFELFECNGVRVWLDGGWAVDALLGRQTRPHRDLDIAVHMPDLPALRVLLDQRGYRAKDEENAAPWNPVLTDRHGSELDVHAFVLDAGGNGVLGRPEDEDVYPAHAFTGAGTILGRWVRCLAAEDVIAFHSGYALDADDCRDVAALCEQFGFALPAEVAAAQQRLGRER